MNVKVYIVDDDKLNNLLGVHLIRKTVETAEVKCFEYPAEALKYFYQLSQEDMTDQPNVILLDINMPEISGWDFLVEFEQLPVEFKKRFDIYMVTSSIDPQDRRRADAINFIKGFISKPLRADILKSILQ
jgi:CheY-like chemotaxis protein